MATTLGLKFAASVNGSYDNARDLGSVGYPVGQGIQTTFTNGVTADKANLLFDDQRTLSASATENLDLVGVLLDAYGNTLSFVKVNGIYIEAASTNTNNVVVGGHATAPFLGPFTATATISLPPGAYMMLVCPNLAGWGVTATTGDMIKVANSGGTTGVDYKVIIVGRDA